VQLFRIEGIGQGLRAGQVGTSICDLPSSDVTSIAKTVDIKDLVDGAGWRQMRDIASQCEASAPDDGRRAAWKTMAKVLKLRSP
jgi:hypothetical protein